MTSTSPPHRLLELPSPVLTQIVIAVARESHGSFAPGFDRTCRRSLAIVIDAAAHVLRADAAFKAASGRDFVRTTRPATRPPPYEAELVARANNLLSGMANLRPLPKEQEEQAPWSYKALGLLPIPYFGI